MKNRVVTHGNLIDTINYSKMIELDSKTVVSKIDGPREVKRSDHHKK